MPQQVGLIVRLRVGVRVMVWVRCFVVTGGHVTVSVRVTVRVTFRQT